MGRIILELERIYKVRQGSANKKGYCVGDTPLVGDVSQSDIAKELNIDSESYRRYKKLTTLIPELQDMVDSDQISTSVASRVLPQIKVSRFYYHFIYKNNKIRTLVFANTLTPLTV